MAGDWMKIDHDTPEKPEVIAVAAKLGISTDEALGKCVRFWRWFDRHTTNGVAKGVTMELLDHQLNAVGLCLAMAAVGWLTTLSDGLKLPNFHVHNGETAKARALAFKRQRSSRAKRDKNVTKTLPEQEAEQEIEKEAAASAAAAISKADEEAIREFHTSEVAKANGRIRNPEGLLVEMLRNPLQHGMMRDPEGSLVPKKTGKKPSAKEIAEKEVCKFIDGKECSVELRKVAAQVKDKMGVVTHGLLLKEWLEHLGTES
jgi:hypothetical protein